MRDAWLGFTGLVGVVNWFPFSVFRFFPSFLVSSVSDLTSVFTYYTGYFFLTLFLDSLFDGSYIYLHELRRAI